VERGLHGVRTTKIEWRPVHFFVTIMSAPSVTPIGNGFLFTLLRNESKVNYLFDEHTVKIENRDAVHYVMDEIKAMIGAPSRYIADDEGRIHCISARSKNGVVTQVWLSKEEGDMLRRAMYLSMRG
jgi:hypothetical protein